MGLTGGENERLESALELDVSLVSLVVPRNEDFPIVVLPQP